MLCGVCLQGVGVLAKSTTFAKNPRQLQYEADINKLFMFTRFVFVCNEFVFHGVSKRESLLSISLAGGYVTYGDSVCCSYNRLGRDAEEADAEEIIEMDGKATLSEQQKQVQENIHYQLENFCASMDEILLPHNDKTQELKADNVPTADKPCESLNNRCSERTYAYTVSCSYLDHFSLILLQHSGS